MIGRWWGEERREGRRRNGPPDEEVGDGGGWVDLEGKEGTSCLLPLPPELDEPVPDQGALSTEVPAAILLFPRVPTEKVQGQLHPGPSPGHVVLEEGVGSLVPGIHMRGNGYQDQGRFEGGKPELAPQADQLRARAAEPVDFIGKGGGVSRRAGRAVQALGHILVGEVESPVGIAPAPVTHAGLQLLHRPLQALVQAPEELQNGMSFDGMCLPGFQAEIVSGGFGRAGSVLCRRGLPCLTLRNAVDRGWLQVFLAVGECV